MEPKDPKQKNSDKNKKQMTEKQKRTLFILTVTGTVIMNVATSLFQVAKARKK